MLKPITLHSALFAAVVACISVNAFAVQLISEEEAKLPKQAQSSTRAGLTRGPTVEIVSPKPDDGIAKQTKIVVKFKPYGGSKISLDDVRFVLLSKPRIDIADRIASYVKEDGIVIPDAELPVGNHQFMVQISDSDGRVGKATLVMNVVR